MYKLFYIFIFCLILSSGDANPSDIVFPTVIIGGGIGGGTAAIYLARGGLQPVVIEGPQIGGALAQSYLVENWPGEEQIAGAELMKRVREQAIKNGALFQAAEVVDLDFSKRPFSFTIRSLDTSQLHTIQAVSCLIATGAVPNQLQVPGETKYWSKGVSSCAICDGTLFKNRVVGVVGGGDSAVLEAIYLANLAKQVILFVRSDRLRATDEVKKAALLKTPNIQIRWKTEVVEILGNEQSVTRVRVKETNRGSTELIPLEGLFLAIGAKPNTQLFQGKLKLDAQGYIETDEGQETSVERVYAIGDVADPLYKQAVSAAGDAAKAALRIQAALAAEAPLLLAELQNKAAPQREGIISTKAFEEPPRIIPIESEAQLSDLLKQSKVPVVVDFYAPWCPPCKRLEKQFPSVMEQVQDRVLFVKINIDSFQNLVAHYKVVSIPTLFLFDQGKIIGKYVGEEEASRLFQGLIRKYGNLSP